ncbi:Hypothetical_protein [Hexamita inflata]|uniref:Hypothetical_protein n=1 Tax=Hexamita inflata TaxID=28002 RepID=A0AA86PER3_9EUKA|nr:Hypothetical protein HINF_LOCUS25429 [Hexamita inflata]
MNAEELQVLRNPEETNVLAGVNEEAVYFHVVVQFLNELKAVTVNGDSRTLKLLFQILIFRLYQGVSISKRNNFGALWSEINLQIYISIYHYSLYFKLKFSIYYNKNQNVYGFKIDRIIQKQSQPKDNQNQKYTIIDDQKIINLIVSLRLITMQISNGSTVLIKNSGVMKLE